MAARREEGRVGGPSRPIHPGRLGGGGEEGRSARQRPGAVPRLQGLGSVQSHRHGDRVSPLMLAIFR